jgi:hypothetical protein
LFKRFPQLQRRGGFYSHPAAAADAASAVYHHPELLGGLPVYSTPPTNTNTGVGAFGLSRYSSLVSDFSCWRLRSHCIAICFSKVQRSSNLIAAISHRVQVPEAVPTAISSQKIGIIIAPQAACRRYFCLEPIPSSLLIEPTRPGRSISVVQLHPGFELDSNLIRTPSCFSNKVAVM